MKDLIKRWFAPPVFADDPEKTRNAVLLNACAHVFIIFPFFNIIGNGLGGVTPLRTAAVNFFAFGMGLVFRQLLHRGHVRNTGMAMILFGFVVITAAIASIGTIRTPTTTDYLLLVVVAGVLYNLPGILVSAGLSSLAVLGLILAENMGLLPKADFTVTITQWVTYTVLFGITGSLMYFAVQTLRNALTRAQLEITERERVELQLRKLTLAVEQSPASIVITDLQGNIEYANPRFTQTTGYTGAEAMGKNPRILKTDLTPEETHRQLWQTISSGKEWRGEFVNRKKDGSLYYESASISPILGPTGAITHYLAVKEDISERKQFEQALDEVRSRLHLLSDNLEEAALYIYSHNTANQPQFEYVSAGMESLTGVKTEDILQDASLLHACILPEFMQALAALEEKSKQDLGSFELEIRMRHAVTNQVRWMLMRSTPRRRPDGSTVWYGVQMDITERKRSEALLEQANEQLRLRMDKIEQLQVELREQALRDPLTGLYNRRFLSESLEREILRASRDASSVSVIVSDVDNFKKINDSYGHQVGDQFLVQIAKMLKKIARGSDVVCRYGGEEFLLVLPGATTADAKKRAEQIRQKCVEMTIQHEGQNLKISMSFGVATYPNHGSGAEQIVINADRALYQSKNNGRDQVTAWKEPSAK